MNVHTQAQSQAKQTPGDHLAFEEWDTTDLDPKKVVGPTSPICESTDGKVGCDCSGLRCDGLYDYYCGTDVTGGGNIHGYCCKKEYRWDWGMMQTDYNSPYGS